MMLKPVILRSLASKDIEDALTCYITEATEQVALDFIDALEKAYLHISQHPKTGSLFYAHELDLPGLRCWLMNAFAYQLFYLESEESIDLIRILHVRRDIPAWLALNENPE
jgi:toxin ParE1/3/4